MRNREQKQGKKHLISLRKQILRFSVCFSLFIAAAWFLLLSANVRTYQIRKNEKRQAALKEYAQALDNAIVQMNDVTGNIYITNTSFNKISQYKSPAEELNYFHELLNLLHIQVNSNRNLSGLFIYYDNMDKVLYYLNENITFPKKEILKTEGQRVGKSDSVADMVNANQAYMTRAQDDVFFNMLLKKSKAAIVGSVSLKTGLPAAKDASAAYGILYKNEWYATFGMADMAADSRLSSLQQGINHIDRKTVYVQPLETSDMSVMEILPDSLWEYISIWHLLLGLGGVLLIILFNRLNRMISREMAQPLEDMNLALSRLQAGVWEVRFEAPNRIEEIENVRNTVQMMLQEIEDYKIRSYEEQMERQETQLQFLRLQLAPHFYTNCLKNAYYMLMLKEYDNVEKYLLCLSAHLRYLLQKDISMVELRKEADFVRNYIQLQKLMTEKALTLDMQIDEPAFDAKVPILLLQTFVENSIKYGRETEQIDLRIRICVHYRVSENGNYLDIHIFDNGHGFPEELLPELNRKDVSQEQSFGVGIVNLQHRMKICYGENANWYFQNRNGACVDLLIPADGGQA